MGGDTPAFRLTRMGKRRRASALHTLPRDHLRGLCALCGEWFLIVRGTGDGSPRDAGGPIVGGSVWLPPPVTRGALKPQRRQLKRRVAREGARNNLGPGCARAKPGAKIGERAFTCRANAFTRGPSAF